MLQSVNLGLVLFSLFWAKMELFYMYKRDAIVLLGIIAGGGTGVSMVVLLANGLIKNPFI